MSVSKLENRPARTRTRPLILSRFTPYRIVALGHAMGDRLRRAYANENITINEWRVLAVIAQADAVAARDVVYQTPMDKMTVSRAVASLEAKGIAGRSVDARDRRVNMVSLTARGRALFARVSALALDYEDEIMDALTNEERNSLDRILAKLSRVTGAAGCETNAP